MKDLSLEQQVGQLFMVTIDTRIAARYESYIRTGRLGGGLLRWDIFSAAEAREFNSRMQDWAGPAQAGLPFLIAVDHEGGSLFTQRTLGLTIFPGNMALGAAGDPVLAESAARASGRELAALGVHVNFAPVLDVNSNPANPIIGVRSYGEDARAVAELGAAAVRGYLAGGVFPVAKHFPGHGDTSVDSHTGLPSVERSSAIWSSTELPPFARAIAAGVPLVMPAHIRAPGLGAGDEPVTLSSAVLTGLLRRDLGFDGVVVSDSMDMGAITQNYGAGEAAIRAFLAGCDILLLGKTDFPPVYEAFLAAIASGRIPAERLAQSLRRVLALKRLARSAQEKSGPVTRREAEEHRRLAKEIAERSVTLLRDEASALPVKPGPEQTLLAVSFGSRRFTPEFEAFGKALLARHPRSRSLHLAPVPEPAESEAALAEASRADILIIGGYHWGAGEPKEQAKLARSLLALGKPTIWLSLMNPYDARFYPEAKTVLLCYGVTEAALEGAVRVIFGESRAMGRPPVTVD